MGVRLWTKLTTNSRARDVCPGPCRDVQSSVRSHHPFTPGLTSSSTSVSHLQPPFRCGAWYIVACRVARRGTAWHACPPCPTKYSGPRFPVLLVQPTSLSDRLSFCLADSPSWPMPVDPWNRRNLVWMVGRPQRPPRSIATLGLLGALGASFPIFRELWLLHPDLPLFPSRVLPLAQPSCSLRVRGSSTDLDVRFAPGTLLLSLLCIPSSFITFLVLLLFNAFVSLLDRFDHPTSSSHYDIGSPRLPPLSDLSTLDEGQPHHGHAENLRNDELHDIHGKILHSWHGFASRHCRPSVRLWLSRTALPLGHFQPFDWVNSQSSIAVKD